MALPPAAIAFKQVMGPADVLDFKLTLSRGSTAQDPAPMLLNSEEVAGFTLTTTAEAAAAGLQIRSGGVYGPTLVDNTVTFWLAVSPALQSAALFADAGVKLGIEISVTTSNNPPRVKQRTLTVQVAQQ